MSKLRIAVLGSTKGTDMQAIIGKIEGGGLDAEIVVVISDVEDAYILERARKHNIKAVFVDRGKFESKEAFDREILRILKKGNAGLVLLIGYMRIVGKPILTEYKNRIMNIHPSLLPKYAGGKDLNVHELVLKNREKETGCTLHFVTEKVDGGPIILQKGVAVLENDTADTLKERVQKAEQQIILKAIKLFQKGKIVVGGKGGR